MQSSDASARDNHANQRSVFLAMGPAGARQCPPRRRCRTSLPTSSSRRQCHVYAGRALGPFFLPKPTTAGVRGGHGCVSRRANVVGRAGMPHGELTAAPQHRAPLAGRPTHATRWPTDGTLVAPPSARTDVDKPPVVLEPLARAALGELLLLLRCHLGRLSAHLAGTSQRTVHLT